MQFLKCTQRNSCSILFNLLIITDIIYNLADDIHEYDHEYDDNYLQMQSLQQSQQFFSPSSQVI